MRKSVEITRHLSPPAWASFSFCPWETRFPSLEATLRQSKRRRLPFGTFCSRKASTSPHNAPTYRHKSVSAAQQRDHATTESTPRPNDIARLEKLVSRLLQQDSVPTEADVLFVLSSLESTVRQLLGLEHLAPTKESENGSSTSAILSLAMRSRPSQGASQTSTNSLSLDKAKLVDNISELAHQTLCHPPVFITPKILSEYVNIQSLLNKPSTFPEAFQLYASKPIPRPSGSTVIEYSPAKPASLKAAVPPNVANAALDTALRVRSLPLALSIVSNAYATTSFWRNKIFRRALLPVVGASLAPVAAYMLATNIAEQQTGLSSESFTQIAFAGILTYTSCVGSIGWVALATANDQMHRVTWVEGTPLRERWLREEERSALDRIACAWGFREKWRWGEEEGPEWENLKEWIGLRGMILDKISLMEGME